MKFFLLLSFYILSIPIANGQKLSAERLIDMLSVTNSKLESQLFKKKYWFSGTESLGDTIVKTYSYDPVIKNSKEKQTDSVSRRLVRSNLKETFTLTYQTTLAAEYNDIIESLKKHSFHCEYEKDSTINPASHLYQHEEYTADASIKKTDDVNWYSITVHKKIFPLNKDLHFAEDLLDFTSNEYLVYYFGEKNVKKDIYYFSGNDIVKCSVLFINTRRQVIFIWRDALNQRTIDNVLIGGTHKLKSQKSNDKFIAENDWMLKSRVHAGMPIFELRTLNEKNFTFCAGDAINPGIVLSESTGNIDFKTADIILGCMNCTDDKYLTTKIMSADRAMADDRILFVLTIVLYPLVTGLFE
jgi:hypothetical protein